MKKKKIAAAIVSSLAALYAAGGIGVTALTFKNSYKAYNIQKYSLSAHWDFYKDRYNRREITFDSRGNTLKGHIYEAKKPKGLIVFSHGIWSGPEEYLTLITWFVDKGWDVLAYTYTSYNGSEGKSAKGLPQSPIDLDAALTYVESDEMIRDLPRVVMGHSWGAYATTAALAYGHHIDGVVAFSGFSDPVEISVSVGEGMVGPLAKTLGWSIDGMNKFLFGKESRQTAVDGINSISAPVLLVHGTNDDFIGYDTTSIVCHKDEITNPNVEYLTLDNPVQSGHNNYFTSEDATLYCDELKKKFAEIEKEYPKKEVPEDVRKEFFEKVDLTRANKPNEELFEKVEQFLEEKAL